MYQSWDGEFLSRLESEPSFPLLDCARLLRAYQVPHGLEDHGRKAEIGLLQKQTTFHRRLQENVTELQG
jgi:hypothetical protein